MNKERRSPFGQGRNRTAERSEPGRKEKSRTMRGRDFSGFIDKMIVGLINGNYKVDPLLTATGLYCR